MSPSHKHRVRVTSLSHESESLYMVTRVWVTKKVTQVGLEFESESQVIQVCKLLWFNYLIFDLILITLSVERKLLIFNIVSFIFYKWNHTIKPQNIKHILYKEKIKHIIQHKKKTLSQQGYLIWISENKPQWHPLMNARNR